MQESCYCGRTGEISDREPVALDDGATGLACPDKACGHIDRLEWLPEDTRRLILIEIERRRPKVA